ncbi:MAG: hypothetical protein WCT23_01070 [Candidatus Neomarinimicrobiota bacterium]
MANKRSIRYLIVFILILLIGSTGIFLTKTDAGFTIVYRIVKNQLDRQHGHDLSIENISTKIQCSLQADKIAFSNADSSLVIKVDTLNINFSGIFELLGRRHLDSLIIIEPEVFITIKDAQDTVEFGEINFPQFLINSIKVERARLHVQTPDTLVQQSIDHLEFCYSGKKKEAQINIKQLDLENTSLGIKIADLSSELTIKHNIAKLRDLNFKLNDSKVTAQGKIRYVDPLRFKLSLHLEELQLDKYVELPFVHKDDKIDMNLDILGDFKEFNAILDLQGTVNNTPILESNIGLEYKDNYLHLLDGAFINADNKLSFYGSYGLKDQYLSLSLIPHKFRLSDWLNNMPDFDARGFFNANGYINSRIDMNYNIDCFDLYGLSKTSFTGNVEFNSLDEIILDSSNQIVLPGGLLKVEGSINDLTEFDLNINGDIDRISGLDIAELSHFDLVNMDLTLKLDGEIKDPHIQMNFNLDTLDIGKINLNDLTVSFFSKNTISEPGGALLITMKEVNLDSLKLGSIQSYVYMREDLIKLDYLDIIHEDYNLSLAGSIRDYKEFKINKMQGVYRGEDVYLLDPVTFERLDNAYSLSRYDILFRDALLSGFLNMNGDSLEGSFNIAGAELNSVPLLSTIVDSVEGLLDLNVDISGFVNDPQIDMDLQLKRAFAFGLKAQMISSKINYSDSLVLIHDFNLEVDNERSIEFYGQIPLSISFASDNIVDFLPEDSMLVELKFNKMRLKKLLPFFLTDINIYGELDALGSIKGTFNDPLINGQLFAYDPQIDAISMDSVIADYHYSNERIFFNDVELFTNKGYYQGNSNFYIDLRFQSTSERFQADSSLYAYIEGNDDELIYLTPYLGFVESFSGKMYTELEIMGNFNETKKHGKVKINETVLVIDILGNEIRNINGELILKDNIADVNLRGLLPGQNYFLASMFRTDETDRNFSINGSMDMTNLISPVFDLKLKGDQMSILTLDENINLTTGIVDLDITGRDTLEVRGDVTIQEGSIEYDFNRSPSPATASQAYSQDMKTSYSINAMIDKVYFRNQLLDVTLNGEMVLQKFPNESATRLGGELEVTEGFFNYWASVFVLEQGSSLILDQFENNHQLNFTATKEIRNNTIIASITGELNNPEINFTDENSEMSQAQIVQALTVGEIQDVLTNVGFGSNPDGGKRINLSSATNALLTLAEIPIEQQARQIGAAGGLDRIDIKGGTNGAYIDETTALVIGGRIGRNFYLTYEASQANLMNMEFEYRLNNRLSIIGAADEKKVEGAVRLRVQY